MTSTLVGYSRFADITVRHRNGLSSVLQRHLSSGHALSGVPLNSPSQVASPTAESQRAPTYQRPSNSFRMDLSRNNISCPVCNFTVRSAGELAEVTILVLACALGEILIRSTFSTSDVRFLSADPSGRGSIASSAADRLIMKWNSTIMVPIQAVSSDQCTKIVAGGAISSSIPPIRSV